MRLRFASFRARFTLWAIVSLVVLPLVALVATDLLHRLIFTRTGDRVLEAEARRLLVALTPCWGAVRGAEGHVTTECLDRELRSLFPRRVAYAQLLELPEAPEGRPRVLARSYAMLALHLPLLPETRQALAAGRSSFLSVPPYDFDTFNRIVTLPVPGDAPPRYALQFGLDLFAERHDLWSREALAKRPHLYLAVLPLLLIAASVWGFYFMKRVFAPVHDIVALAQRIGAENLTQRIEHVESDDEIGELATTLNAMIARLERSFRQMEQFSSDVAHELRTPLTIIKGEVELALKRERTMGEYRAALASLLEEAERLGALIEDLLLLARMESGRDEQRFGAVELDALLLEAYEAAAVLGQRRDVTVAIEPLDEACIRGEPGLLRRLLDNLFRNAVSYTSRGGRVVASLAATTDEVTVEVRDTGCGIPEDSLPHVFDRFYRVDPSRSHETGGTGLGLAIVQKIAGVHRARVEAESRLGLGSTFRVTFPRV